MGTAYGHVAWAPHMGTAHAPTRACMRMHLQFEDLLSEAEAEAVVDRCRNFGKFERSQVLQSLMMMMGQPRVVLHPLTLLAGRRSALPGAHLDAVLV